MPGTPGPRTGLSDILTGDPANEYRIAVNAIRSWLESNATLTSSGLFADRPPSSPSTPGISGRSYFATDLQALLRDTGTGWVATGATTVGVYSARPPVSTDLNGLKYFATDKAMEWICSAGAWVLTYAYAPEVTSLPASPIDGQRCVLILDAAAGITVPLRYRAASSSTYKWEPEGVPAPIEGWSSLNWGAVTSASYVNLTPSLVIPFGGDWDIEPFSEQAGIDTAGEKGFLSYKIGAAAASDTDALVVKASASVVDGDSRSDSFRRRKTAIAASTVLQAVGRRTAGNFYPTGNQTVPYGLRAWPVRLG
jgi:hypothetical protein